MKKVLLIIYLSLFLVSPCLAVSSISVNNRIDVLEESIKRDYTTKELMRQEYKDAVMQSSWSVSNMLSTQNIFIAILAFVLATAWVSISVYIYRINTEMRKTLGDIESLKKDIESFINDKESQMAKKTIIAVLKSFIDKLEFEPNNISNIYPILTTLDFSLLWIDYYKKTKNAYLLADNDYKNCYKSFIFQHFTDLLIEDDDDILWEDIGKNLESDFKSRGSLWPTILTFHNNETLQVLNLALLPYLRNKTKFQDKFKLIMDYFKTKGKLEQHKTIFTWYFDDKVIKSYFEKEKESVKEITNKKPWKT